MLLTLFLSLSDAFGSSPALGLHLCGGLVSGAGVSVSFVVAHLRHCRAGRDVCVLLQSLSCPDCLCVHSLAMVADWRVFCPCHCRLLHLGVLRRASHQWLTTTHRMSHRKTRLASRGALRLKTKKQNLVLRPIGLCDSSDGTDSTGRSRHRPSQFFFNLFFVGEFSCFARACLCVAFKT